MAIHRETDLGTPPVAADVQVTLQIDGQPVTVPAGTTVMRAAALADIPVPKLCATDKLEAFGSCRLCLVEIEGRKGTPASCTTLVEQGMKVTTQNDRLAKLRRGVMELYLSDYPVDPLATTSGGASELQDMVAQVGLREVRYGFAGANHQAAAVDDSNPYFSFDPAKCIVCSRCVRACADIQGTFALTIDGRGFGSKVSAGMAEHFLDSECVSCGACVDACPTSSLMDKSVIQHGMPNRSVVTTCAYCGVGCSFEAELQGNRVVRMTPHKDGKANHGHSCVKGRFAWGYAGHADRITQPMIRSSIHEPWQEVSWDEAIGHAAASEFRRIQAKYGRGCDRRDHQFALHQRGDLPRPENGPRRLRQQQCRHLRTRLPLADRLRPEDDVRHLGRHPGLRFGHAVRRDAGDRCEPDRGPPGVRLADEEAPAPGCQADRDRPAPHRPGAHPARAGRASFAAQARHQRRGHQRDRACHRHRGHDRRGVRGRALRSGRF